MFAPRPFDVAKEMVRVTRPGGRIVMGNWIPGDPTLVAQILQDQLRVLAAAAGGLRQPDDVGRRGARARAVRGGRRARQTGSRSSATRTRSTSPGTPSEFLDEFRTYYGPTMNAYEAARADGRADDLHAAELEALFNEQNRQREAARRSRRRSCASRSRCELLVHSGLIHLERYAAPMAPTRGAAVAQLTTTEAAVLALPRDRGGAFGL